MKIAKEKRSSVLASNAYHHRVDSLTAFVALLTISASHFFTSAQWLDPVGGLIISGMIVQAGWGNTKNALLELADVGMDEEVREHVHRVAVTALQEHVGQHASILGTQGIKSGQNFMVDIEVAAPDDWSIAHAREVEAVVRHEIGSKVRGVRRVTVRFTNKRAEDAAFQDEFIAVKAGDPKESSAEHDHVHGHHESLNGNTDATTNGVTRKQQ